MILHCVSLTFALLCILQTAVGAIETDGFGNRFLYVSLCGLSCLLAKKLFIRCLEIE